MAETALPGTGARRPAGSRWLACREPRPTAFADLYCFAHAGGSAGEFVRWSDELPGVQVRGVKMPGRAPREHEPPFVRMTDIVEALLEEVEFGPGPFAFFGHSLGGLVAHELTRALRDTGRPQPRRLFVSSVQPPPVTARRPVHRLPAPELVTELERRWGPLPSLVHEDEGLRDLVLGYFRADMEIAETYGFVPGTPLDIPLTAFVGAEEDGELSGWRALTTGEFAQHTVPGGHFHFRNPGARQELLRLVHRAMTADR
ncbi:thioesterase II family protein [Streptomyces sp. NPDC127033]|uniref:thioesterase II family protein n=1 Tax=Streptomyces sp. NPDC127033 TaxID=3347110 RepID=UPI00365F41A8